VDAERTESEHKDELDGQRRLIAASPRSSDPPLLGHTIELVDDGGRRRVWKWPVASTKAWWALLASAVIVLVAMASWAVLVSGDRVPVGGNGGASTPAETNLETSLTGARTYYSVAGGTFSGLFVPATSAPSSLAEMNTGLSYVAGRPSTGVHVVSGSVGGAGSWVILVTFAPSMQDCFGVLDLTRSASASVDGIDKFMGVYDFVVRHTSSAECNAARITSVNDVLRAGAGFPNA